MKTNKRNIVIVSIAVVVIAAVIIDVIANRKAMSDNKEQVEATEQATPDVQTVKQADSDGQSTEGDGVTDLMPDRELPAVPIVIDDGTQENGKTESSQSTSKETSQKSSSTTKTKKITNNISDAMNVEDEQSNEDTNNNDIKDSSKNTDSKNTDSKKEQTESKDKAGTEAAKDNSDAIELPFVPAED